MVVRAGNGGEDGGGGQEAEGDSNLLLGVGEVQLALERPL